MNLHASTIIWDSTRAAANRRAFTTLKTSRATSLRLNLSGSTPLLVLPSFSPWCSRSSASPRVDPVSRFGRSFHSQIIAQYSMSAMAAPGTNDLGIDGGKKENETSGAGEGSTGSAAARDLGGSTIPSGSVPAQSSSSAPTETKVAETEASPLVMQIVVRRDLLEAEGWGVGPLMAQVAHATAAVLHETRERPETVEYLRDLLRMRKVVMQTATDATLQKLATTLSSSEPPVPFHLWIEQPENVPTCLALAPNRVRDGSERSKKVKKALDKCGCRLWKG